MSETHLVSDAAYGGSGAGGCAPSRRKQWSPPTFAACLAKVEGAARVEVATEMEVKVARAAAMASNSSHPPRRSSQQDTEDTLTLTHHAGKSHLAASTYQPGMLCKSPNSSSR